MKAGLLWRLCWIVAAGTVFLFWIINYLSSHAEWQMSIIAQEHQQKIMEYGEEAERLYLAGDDQALADWIESVKTAENTWVAVVSSSVTPHGGSYLSEQFEKGYGLGRALFWKIHLYFPENPIMQVPFADNRTFFLIKLPPYMRPGGFLTLTQLFLQLALPFLVLAGLALVVYRHIMTPLQSLERATRKFSQGNYDVRVGESFGSRKDELSALADTFDQMAERTGNLIVTQRQLIGDLSHELRTPLSRIDMALEGIEQGLPQQQAYQRLRTESGYMRELVEDALTLAWLSTESPQLNKDDFDLAELIRVICEDANFEYPDRGLSVELPNEAPMTNSSQRAIGQAIENVIRNALKHTPVEQQVTVSLTIMEETYRVEVKDQGQGVPEQHLLDIFKPFFQIESARTQHSDGSSARDVGSVSASSETVSAVGSDASDDVNNMTYTPTKKKGGFGLGLALAQRQIVAVGGQIRAENYQERVNQSPSVVTASGGLAQAISPETVIVTGLKMIITLPRC